MRGVIRLHDKHTHDGMVVQVSTTPTLHGKPVAVKGDIVMCPEHGLNPIIEGSATWKINGKPVALHGHKCECGCSLITSLPTVGEE